MTLRELLQLMKRYWALCVILPIVCALGCGLYFIHKAETVYPIANSFLVVGNSDQLAAVNGATQSVVRDYTAIDPTHIYAAKAETASQTVTITVTGMEDEETLIVADEVANVSAEKARKLFEGEEIELSVSVQPAILKQAETPASFPLVQVIIGFLAGLFVAICIVVGIDIVRCPVKNPNDLAQISCLPVIGELPSDPGEFLLANVRLASKKDSVRTLLVVPARNGDSAKYSCDLIEKAARGESEIDSKAHGGPIVVTACAPLQQDAAGIYAAREADAVLIAVSQWVDTHDDVEMAVSQLKLIDANVVGCVLVAKAAKRSVAE